MATFAFLSLRCTLESCRWWGREVGHTHTHRERGGGGGGGEWKGLVCAHSIQGLLVLFEDNVATIYLPLNVQLTG